jgi:hypothetical protein
MHFLIICSSLLYVYSSKESANYDLNYFSNTAKRLECEFKIIEVNEEELIKYKNIDNLFYQGPTHISDRNNGDDSSPEEPESNESESNIIASSTSLLNSIEIKKCTYKIVFIKKDLYKLVRTCNLIKE